MKCNRCDAPGTPRREHAERVLCDRCAAKSPIIDWQHPPPAPDPEQLKPRALPELEPPHSPMRAPQTGGGFVLDVPDTVPAIWGDGDDVLWAAGEPLMICVPQGVGKTTLAQQLALPRAGVLEPTLLGLPVAPDDRKALYIAADRPAQAARSMRRMVTEDQRDQLDKRLLAWRGPVPFMITDDPRRLAAWLTRLGVGTVVIDSLKDNGRRTDRGRGRRRSEHGATGSRRVRHRSCRTSTTSAKARTAASRGRSKTSTGPRG